MSKPKDIQAIKGLATAFIIFGATGELSQTRLFPALYELFREDYLPQNFKIIASARSKLTTGQFRDLLKERVEPSIQKAWDNFANRIEYMSADVEQNINLSKIETALNTYEQEVGVCAKRVFYMAISPTIYEKSIENLGINKLNLGCKMHTNRARIIIEKPFGHDLTTAKSLNLKLAQYFVEDQIYRIDHYLGKETVQNIFAFRFGNELFEPIWNNKFVDSVQITAAEYVGVEKRGDYYDQAGALRDVTQNHLLQLIALVAMDTPQSFNAQMVRSKKLETIKAIRKMKKEEIISSTVRAQYEGYKKEEKVNDNSLTETYAYTKFHIDNPRWQGVPFYVRTGKRLTGKVTSIIFEFKERGHLVFENFWDKKMPNHITLQIQPNEGIGIRLVAKKPGLETQLEPVDMEFCYKTSFGSHQPDAYERLLLDVILGDQTLFIDQETIEESWKIIDPIIEVWQSNKVKLATYPQGSWGPEEVEKLIQKDGRTWLAPLLTICKI